MQHRLNHVGVFEAESQGVLSFEQFQICLLTRGHHSATYLRTITHPDLMELTYKPAHVNDELVDLDLHLV